jgi:hypothetical protein
VPAQHRHDATDHSVVVGADHIAGWTTTPSPQGRCEPACSSPCPGIMSAPDRRKPSGESIVYASMASITGPAHTARHQRRARSPNMPCVVARCSYDGRRHRLAHLDGCVGMMLSPRWLKDGHHTTARSSRRTVGGPAGGCHYPTRPIALRARFAVPASPGRRRHTVGPLDVRTITWPLMTPPSSSRRRTRSVVDQPRYARRTLMEDRPPSARRSGRPDRQQRWAMGSPVWGLRPFLRRPSPMRTGCCGWFPRETRRSMPGW